MNVQSWRSYLFARGWMGYDRFITQPRTRPGVPCRVCGAACREERDRYAVADAEADLGSTPWLHDRFECPYRYEDWHREARTLVVAIDEGAEPAARRQLWARLEKILRQQGIPPVGS